jgi:hypothetical protein
MNIYILDVDNNINYILMLCTDNLSYMNWLTRIKNISVTHLGMSTDTTRMYFMYDEDEI